MSLGLPRIRQGRGVRLEIAGFVVDWHVQVDLGPANAADVEGSETVAGHPPRSRLVSSPALEDSANILGVVPFWGQRQIPVVGLNRLLFAIEKLEHRSV